MQACREVEDAMASHANAQQRIALLSKATQASQYAYRLARDRFEAGAIDFQTLLDTQRSVLQAEDEQVQAQLALFVASTQWIKAFAGG